MNLRRRSRSSPGERHDRTAAGTRPTGERGVSDAPREIYLRQAGMTR